MSSKTGPDAPRAGSLAARLTAWYAGSAFLLVLSATGFLYGALAHNLDREDDEFLAEKVWAVQAILDRDLNGDALRQELATVVGSDSGRIFVRVLGPNGEWATPGMSEVLPGDVFAPAGSVAPDEQFADYRSPAGRSFRLLTVSDDKRHCTVHAAMDRTAEMELFAEYRKHLWVVLGAALVLC